MEATQKVLEGRRITIPKAIRDAMNIEEGDLITVDVLRVVKKKE